MEHDQAVKSYYFEGKTSWFYIKFVNFVSAVPEALFPEVYSLVLCAHTEYQNKTLSGELNKVDFFFLKNTIFPVRCKLVLTL